VIPSYDAKRQGEIFSISTSFLPVIFKNVNRQNQNDQLGKCF